MSDKPSEVELLTPQQKGSTSEETIASIMQAAAPLVQMFIESQTEAAKMQAAAAKMQMEAQLAAQEREIQARIKAAEATSVFLVQLIRLGGFMLAAGFVILVVAMFTGKEQFVLTILKYGGSVIAGAGTVEALRKFLNK